MILADKIVTLRKRAGWSQEELAAQLGVSRQSVSKWEGAQSVPDMQKVVQMSRLFGVTTDYLLKEELGEPEPDRKSTRLNSSHLGISYAVFCLPRSVTGRVLPSRKMRQRASACACCWCSWRPRWRCLSRALHR